MADALYLKIMEALSVDPDHVHSLFYLSQLAWERGDPARARWAIDRATGLMDYNPTVTPELRAEIESWARDVERETRVPR